MFKHIVLFYLLIFKVNAAQVDSIDKHCIDMSVAVFQAHQSYLNDGRPDAYRIDLNKSSTYDGCFFRAVPVRIDRSTTPDYFKDWGELLPIYGKTGLDHSWTGDQRQETFLGMVGYHPQENLLIISFRGTREYQDWWNNANFNRRKPEHMDDRINLHAGYLDVFESSLQSLARCITELIEDLPISIQDEVYVAITGHSLGGSVAATSIPFMRQRFPFQCMSLRMFGSPKVGGEDYNQWLKDKAVTTKSFMRETDLSPANPSGYGLTYLGDTITLPHYDDPWYLWPKAHDDRKYRRGIYEYLELPYDTGPTHDITVKFWGREYKV